MATPTITSELDAINLMLSCIGEAPVSSIDTSISEVEMAQIKLNKCILEVLTRGRTFNKEEDFPLQPDENGEVVIPQDALWIDTTKLESNDLVQRGTRLYDRRLHTYNINRVVKCDIILALPFEEMPFPARLYVTIKAAREFQADVQGSETVFRFSLQSEQEAQATFEAMDAQSEDANVLNGNYHAWNVIRRYGR